MLKTVIGALGLIIVSTHAAQIQLVNDMGKATGYCISITKAGPIQLQQCNNKDENQNIIIHVGVIGTQDDLCLERKGEWDVVAATCDNNKQTQHWNISDGFIIHGDDDMALDEQDGLCMGSLAGNKPPASWVIY